MLSRFLAASKKRGKTGAVVSILTPLILQTARIPWMNHLLSSPIEDDSSEEYQQFEV